MILGDAGTLMIMLCADVCWVQTLIEEGDSLLIHSLRPACLISGWDGDVRHTDAANDVEKKRQMFLFLGCSANLHQECAGETKLVTSHSE